MFFIIKNETYNGIVYAETTSELFWQIDSTTGCPYSCYYYPCKYKNFSIAWDEKSNPINSEGDDVMMEYDFININPKNIPLDDDCLYYSNWFEEFNFYYGGDFMSHNLNEFCVDFFTKENMKSYKKYNALELRKNEFKTCDYCQELYYASRQLSRTCSRLCRVKKHRKNKRSKI